MTETRHWLTPRAYIIRMTGSQTRQMQLCSQARSEAAYQEYVAKLANEHREQ